MHEGFSKDVQNRQHVFKHHSWCGTESGRNLQHWQGSHYIYDNMDSVDSTVDETPVQMFGIPNKPAFLSEIANSTECLLRVKVRKLKLVLMKYLSRWLNRIYL